MPYACWGGRCNDGGKSPLRLGLRVHAKLADLGGAAALDEVSVRRTTDGAAAGAPCREEFIRWSILTSDFIHLAMSR